MIAKKPHGYWTLERCLSDAEKYQKRNQWCIESNGAYNSACKNKWLDICCKHMITKDKKPNNFWTLIECQNEAKKYNSKSEWQKFNDTSYRKALHSNWLTECCEHMNSKIIKPKKYWNITNCINDAKKYNYRSVWAKASSAAYSSALKNKWLTECCKHMKVLGDYKNRMIYSFEFSDKSVYVGLTHDIDERINRHCNDKRSIVYKTILNKIDYTIKELSNYINIYEAIELENKFVIQYKTKNWKVLNRIKTGGVGGIMKKWTKDKCLVEALKYTSKTEWWKNCSKSYNAAQKNKWVDDCSLHMISLRKPNGYWTLENCKKSAIKFNTKAQWRKNENAAYAASKRFKYLDEINKTWQQKVNRI